MGALFAAHHRGQQLEADALGQGDDLVHHLVDGFGPNRTLALGAVGFAGAAKQQPQIVLDFSDGAHGGPGVVAGGFLVDGDGRREALDGINIGFVHLAQKLAGIGGQTLHIAPLALSEDRVEGQGALAATANASEDHQFVARNRQIDIAQVVLTGTPHPDHIVQAAAVEGLESGLLDHGGLMGSQRLTLAGSCDGAGHEEPSAAADSREGGCGTLRSQAPDPIL